MLGPVATEADIERMESVPLDVGMPFETTYDLLRRSADLFADRPALLPLHLETPQGPGVSYRELLAGVVTAAAQFRRHGLAAGETVAIVLPNFVETHFAIWGAEAVGRACLINPFLEAEHIAAIMKATQARLAVVEAAGDGRAASPRVAAALEMAPDVTTAILVTTRFGDEAGTVRPGDSRPLPARVARAAFDGPDAPPSADLPVTATPSGLASYLHTGGTTGAPKVAARTHWNEASQGWTFSGVAGLVETDVLLCGLPLFHSNGVTVTGVAPFARGACVLLATPDGYRDPRLIERFWAVARKHRVTHFAGVPTIYSRLLETFDAPAPSLKFGICGAAPLSIDLFRTFERRTGVRILEGYGLTEAGCVSTLNPLSGVSRVGSIGLRLPYQRLKTVRARSHGAWVDCADGETGVLAIQGPNVFDGYVDPRHNTDAFTPDGWLVTGDIGRIDADGFVWLAGRAKDVIIRGGHNVDPSVGESALHAHPAVALAAVVGGPDANLGEVPIGYVTLRAGLSASPQALLDHARRTASERAAAPVRVEILPDLPLTPVGKIFKPALRRRAAQTAVEHTLRDLACEGRVEQDAHGLLSCILTSATESARREAVARLSRLAPQMSIEAP